MIKIFSVLAKAVSFICSILALIFVIFFCLSFYDIGWCDVVWQFIINLFLNDMAVFSTVLIIVLSIIVVANLIRFCCKEYEKNKEIKQQEKQTESLEKRAEAIKNEIENLSKLKDDLDTKVAAAKKSKNNVVNDLEKKEKMYQHYFVFCTKENIVKAKELNDIISAVPSKHSEFFREQNKISREIYKSMLEVEKEFIESQGQK